MRSMANAAMAVLIAIQDLPQHEQVAAPAAVVLLLAEHFGLTPQDIFTPITNIMVHAETRRPEFRAVAMFIEEEMS